MAQKYNKLDYNIWNKQFFQQISPPYDSGNHVRFPFEPEDQDMSRNLLLAAAAAVTLLLPNRLPAGGLPRLCIPIDGVTADNAEICAGRLSSGLGDSVEGMAIKQNDGLWYAMFYFNLAHVRLSQIEAALEGTPFSVPRDRLRLFGPVVLEFDAHAATPDRLKTDLAAIPHVLVGEAERENGRLLVKVDMPNANYFGRQTREFGSRSFSKEVFQGTHFSSNVTARSAASATLHDLPSYNALREAVTKHNVDLKDIRWRCWGCSVLGCLTVRKADAEVGDVKDRRK